MQLGIDAVIAFTFLNDGDNGMSPWDNTSREAIVVRKRSPQESNPVIFKIEIIFRLTAGTYIL